MCLKFCKYTTVYPVMCTHTHALWHLRRNWVCRSRHHRETLFSYSLSLILSE
jgi:hypothetical protein